MSESCELLERPSFNLSAIDRVGASRSSVIVGTSAVFAAIFAVVITGERPNLLVTLGTAAVVIGLVISTGETLRQGCGGSRRALIAYALALVVAASYEGSIPIAKELTLSYGSPLMVSALSLVFGVLLLAPAAGRHALHDVRVVGLDFGFAKFAGCPAFPLVPPSFPCTMLFNGPK